MGHFRRIENRRIKKFMEFLILAIETSCDDTSVAVMHNKKILSNIVSSQLDHSQYGGVVPELASRKHLVNIQVVLEEALKKANILLKDIDAIAFTQGPGLLGSLLVGINYAKGLSMALQKPLIAVNHMEAHILAHWIDYEPELPFLCLTVSGGHTCLTWVQDNPLNHQIIGKTIDDAAGEAFDKIAKLLGLNYPGGPLIDKLAQNGQPIYKFPKPDVPNYQYSFSGFKTAVKNFLKDFTSEDLQKELPNICASVQNAIVNILLEKFTKAITNLKPQSIGIAGGVSANSELRKKVFDLGNQWNIPTYIPKFEYCTDNAAMIAITAHYKFLKNDFCDLRVIPYTKIT